MQRPADRFADHLHEVVGDRVDVSLLLRALTHRSYAYENGGLPNNERLEFLGDSVLGLVVTDTLYATHPELPEGQLAKLRAAVVNMRALAEVARTLGLGEHLLLGRGEESTGGRDKASILADTMEAVIGTVYLSCGLPAASTLVHHLLDPLMAPDGHPRCRPGLEDQPPGARGRRRPRRPRVPGRRGGPGPREDLHRARRRGRCGLGEGAGRSKKEAEQKAAEAWRLRTVLERPVPPHAVRRRPRRPTDRPTRPPVPELPEVEVVRRGLADHVVGRTIERAEFRGARVARRHVPGPHDLADRLAGNHVERPAGAASTSGWSCAPPTAPSRG